MKKIKAVVAVLLCFVMLLSMAGCGTKEKDAGGSTTTVEKPKNEEDKMKAYDPAITMTFNKSEVVTAYPEGMDAQNNALYQMWEDIMGIKVENSIRPSSSMTEENAAAIGSNEIPDFGIVDATMMATLIKNDMVEDMSRCL